MKHRLRAVLVLAPTLILPRLALAQQPKVQVKTAPTAAEAAAIAQEQRILQALLRGDVAAMNDALGQPSLMVGSDGISIWTADTTVAFMKLCTTRSLTASDFRSVAAGKDVVVIAYRSEATHICRGQSAHGVGNALSVWERKDDRWSQVAHSETVAPVGIEGAYEYLPPLKGLNVFQGGRFSFVFGPSDGSAGMTANAGTYQMVGDTVVSTILYTTDPGNPPGARFRWIAHMLAPDTLVYTLIDSDGGVIASGRTVRVR